MPKKKVIYTIQRLYHEGKVLLEKYGISEDRYQLRVSFTVEQNNDGHPKLTISMRYDDERLISSSHSYFGYGPTPQIALAGFEEDLQNKSGKTLMERLGTEVADA